MWRRLLFTQVWVSSFEINLYNFSVFIWPARYPHTFVWFLCQFAGGPVHLKCDMKSWLFCKYKTFSIRRFPSYTGYFEPMLHCMLWTIYILLSCTEIGSSGYLWDHPREYRQICFKEVTLRNRLRTRKRLNCGHVMHFSHFCNPFLKAKFYVRGERLITSACSLVFARVLAKYCLPKLS